MASSVAKRRRIHPRIRRHRARPPRPSIPLDQLTVKRRSDAWKTGEPQMAEKMPDADFGFKPGTSSELRTFGQWVGHQADNQFQN